MNEWIAELNHPDCQMRLDALRRLKKGIDDASIPAVTAGNDVNNHIHTTYSFSPYSPTKAVWMAYNAGLTTAGIMDHDSISGAREFIEAGKIMGMATTIGLECRVDMSATSMNGRRLNNPDQDTIIYMGLHGIPHDQIDTIAAFFKPFSQHRNERNRNMLNRINQILAPEGVSVSFETDVMPLSNIDKGGSITERHLLFAVAHKLIERFGKGRAMVEFLKNRLHLTMSAKLEEYLLDESNPQYDYDLLGVLKADMVEQFYIPASAECPPVADVIALAERTGAISAYAYLGDVGDSVTGDKKTQKFEDDFLDELMLVLKELRFNAVTYMPSRNTKAQLERLMAICDKLDFFQISGEDINQPRQSFVCLAQRDPMFAHLIAATWALIGHEWTANDDCRGMFSQKACTQYPDLKTRIAVYEELGLRYKC